MEPYRWYVKLGEESIGPLSDDEITELTRNGSIGPQTAVSPDQLNWTRAQSVGGLKFPSTPPRDVPSQFSAGRQLAMWKLAALGAVALLVILVVVMAATPREPQPPTAASAMTPGLQAANRTYEYWRQVSGIVKKASAAAPPGLSAFRSAAASVEDLPTAGVDGDAINCALGFAALLKECADLVQSENDPSATADQMLRAFYGGWSGDFQPLVHDLESRNDGHKSMVSHVRNVEQQVIRTRAILSSRYGVEFPSL